MKGSKEFKTLQIDATIKDQIVDYCNYNDLKIGRFVEKLFINHVSGSATAKP